MIFALLACAPDIRLPVPLDPEASAAWLGEPAPDRGVVLELVTGVGVGEAEVSRSARALGAAAARHGVALGVAGPPRAGATALGRDPLGGAEPDAVGRWLAGEAVPARDVVTVVWVQELAGPRSHAARTLGSLVGLALSPEAFSAVPESVVALGPLPDNFTPTVFLSAAALSRMSPEVGGEAVLHEIGHARGLPHVADPYNLMCPDRTAGAQLDAAQRAAFGPVEGT